MGLATFELFTWDFPAECLSMLSAGVRLLCGWLGVSGIPSLVHSTGASICWHLVPGARHLLIWLVFRMNLYCLAGFYVSEKVIHHKSPALLHSVWLSEERVCPSWLLVKIEYEKNSAKGHALRIVQRHCFQKQIYLLVCSCCFPSIHFNNQER